MRSFVPFGNPWKMPIPVPYSFLVRDGNLAWTCGQIPVDMASQVLAPSDLVEQTNIVCDYIETILARAGLTAAGLGKLVLYYVDRTPGDSERMMACCRSRFGDQPVLVPVAVPYFYFDHMLLEVDAFAGVENGRSIVKTAGNATVRLKDGGEHCWVSLTVDPDNLEQGRTVLDATLSEAGISPLHRLSEHWVAAKSATTHLSQIAQNLARCGLIADQGALVKSHDKSADLIGEFTYVKSPTGTVDESVQDSSGVRLVKRRIGRSSWFSIRSTDASLSIVEQTRKIVSALGNALDVDGMNFNAVVKSTTYYAGGSTDAELFENMTIRNHCYATPGPASTGLPVAGFANDESRIIVDVIALADLPENGKTNSEHRGRL